MINLEKRRRVMQRSMRLGHCICDAKKACPCSLFKEKNVCLCAGESLEPPLGPVRLTQLVEKAGCASKIDQASLKRVLQALPEIRDPRVLIGAAAGDDAGVYALDGPTALVQTVDVFSPSVDDPYTFGQVAAANSLSDVYAMGGRPITALSIIGFPIREAPDSVMVDILRGGIDKMNEAGVPVVGGHSIQDAEIKAGFAVTGLIDRRRIVTNAGARPGDRLVLTKPLGTGILAFAVQIGRAPPEAADAIARSMTELNKAASEAMLDLEAHACTDVTGFGLMGHLAEIARSSAVDVEIVWDSLPLFPHVLECLAEGIVPGGIERNRESSESSAVPAAGVTEAMMDLCFDPQTSGGLLVALAPDKAEALVRRLHEEGIRAAAVIGKVRGKGTGKVFVTASGARTIRTPEEEEAMNQRPSKKKKGRSAGAEEPCCAEPAAETCCSEGHAAGASAVGAGAEEMFKAFMKTAGAPGALDAATKQALQIALSVLARCGPCIRIQVEKARKMGFTQAEIDEAVWMAIAFGGAPVMMFYKEVMKT